MLIRQAIEFKEILSIILSDLEYRIQCAITINDYLITPISQVRSIFNSHIIYDSTVLIPRLSSHIVELRTLARSLHMDYQILDYMSEVIDVMRQNCRDDLSEVSWSSNEELDQMRTTWIRNYQFLTRSCHRLKRLVS